MGFTIQCDNKGCMKMQEPEVDTKDNKDPNKWDVLCAECHLPIQSVTYFAKVQMKSMGQIRRAKPQQQAFVVKCGTCLKEGKPKLC